MTNEKNEITLPSVVPVKLLAEELSVSATEVIKKLMMNGVMATLNESIDFDTAAIVADEFGFVAVEQKEQLKADDKKNSVDKSKQANRPPVVTVMGHVDHGKTKILDAIRKTHIIETESGGITQHIGAYQTTIETDDDGKKKKRVITFIDTPGHEAFSKMRAYGANITDIVILVVAADEGVKPQTIEAISHAKAAKVPIIVAINKMDKPEADPDRVKRDLTEYNLVAEEWGGKTPMVPVSAKDGTGIDDLLETVALVADLEELKAPIDCPARGMVIESKIQPGKGPIATVIIKEGILTPGDIFISESDYAKVRFLEDWTGKRIKEARPADPVLVAGFKKAPKVGTEIFTVADDKTAKDLTSKIERDASVRTIKKSTGLGELSQEAKEGKLKELKIVLRTDVKGSLDAIKGSLDEISAEGVKLVIISDGVGNVTESDVNLAYASHGAVIAFRVTVPPQVLKLAETDKVKISKYDVIYELIDDISAALEGMLEPEITETKIGSLEIIKLFRREKSKGIVGGKVISGRISPGTKINVVRDGETIGEIKTDLVQVGGQKVNEVTKGDECGISYTGEIKLHPKDILEFILVEEKLRTLKKKAV